jgi:hypothetical protein
MTEAELAAIQARADAATEGPWEYADSLSGRMGWPSLDLQQGLDGEFLAADALFMAHARCDVPALVAEVRRLAKVVEAFGEWGR